MDVPYVDLAASYRSLKAEVDAAVAEVLASGDYVLGGNVAAFEEEFAGWLGADGAEVVGVNSGTDAIYLTLKALGVGPGDEVITVSHTAVNTALAISKAGAIPVFVDIESRTFCMEPSLLEGAVSERTRAVVPVHLYGHPVDMDPVMEFAARHGLPVVEDCAQAHGAAYKGRPAGTIGAAGCFSFYPTKNLGACGDGGAVVTTDAGLAAKLRSLANCGEEGGRVQGSPDGDNRWLGTRTNIYKGDVSRLDELQAAILRVKLKKLGAWTERRREVAAFYCEALAAPALKLPVEEEWAGHVYHLFVVRTPERDALQRHLAAEGVEARVHYPLPVHLQPAYAEAAGEPSTETGRAAGAPLPETTRAAGAPLPETERAVAEILSLPVFPELTEAQLQQVAQGVLRFSGES